MNSYLKYAGVIMVLMSAGCAKFKGEKKPEFNPIVYDTHFQKEIAAYKIKVVAPASGTDPAKIQQLQTLTFMKMDIPDNLITKDIPFHSNTDTERLKLLKKALYDDSKNTIVWSLRGGYGTTRLIQALKKLPKPAKEKVFIGYSDITALHLFLSQHWQWKTIHGTGFAEFLNPNRDPQNFQKVLDVVSKKTKVVRINNLKLLNGNKSKKISGPLTGGNLAIVQTSLGTNWQIQSAGKILFLEDVGEKGYHIDRSLHHLKQAGVFKNVKAVVFGDFVDPGDDKIDLALARFAQEMKIPVFKTDQFGHGKYNYPLIYNAQSEIVWDKGTETFNLNMHI